MSRDPRTLAVLARVRRVREQDSLVGLRQANREAEAAQEHLDTTDQRLTDLSRTEPPTAGELLTLREGLSTLGDSVTSARSSVDAARLVAAAAEAHWRQDRMRLRTIEMLQERREAEAEAERLRTENAAQDEVATQLWRRNRHLRVVS